MKSKWCVKVFDLFCFFDLHLRDSAKSKQIVELSCHTKHILSLLTKMQQKLALGPSAQSRARNIVNWRINKLLLPHNLNSGAKLILAPNLFWRQTISFVLTKAFLFSLLYWCPFSFWWDKYNNITTKFFKWILTNPWSDMKMGYM